MHWIFSVLLIATTAVDKLVAFTGCYQGSVQLVGGTAYYGIVQVCIGGEWGTVCRSGWDSNDAAVVCRQLGFQATGASTYSLYNSNSSGIQAIYMNNVNCRGTELSLFQCDYQSLIGDYSPCSHGYDDAGVWCSPSACTDGQVRLSGGDVNTEGNVEICNGGKWHGLCGNYFPYQDALVVCRQLRFPNSNIAANIYRYSRYPIMPTYTYGFDCYGYESSITSCSIGISVSCDLFSRAGVSCRGKVVQTESCSGQAVRLVNGTDGNEGYVEVCRSGKWGMIRGGSGSWDSREGQVVCRQLGFQNPAAFIYDSTFGLGTGIVVIDEINCNGNEASVWSCSTYNNNYNTFTQRSSVGLRCENYPINQGCQPASVRLAGGPTAREGRIELCFQSSPGVTIWGSVCNLYSYGVAEVVCRQLNFSRSGAEYYSIAPFGPSQNPFVLDGTYCSGTENSLLSCSSSYLVGFHHCHRGQESGVKCQAPCTSGSVHLVNGYTPTEGRLEMCINGSWTSFYTQNSWDTNASKIACTEMFGTNAFTMAIYSTYPPWWWWWYPSMYGYGTGSVIVDGVSCHGNETRLSNCRYTTSTSIGHQNDVGIRCYVSSSCTEGQVRLADGSTAYEGRVEVCHDRVWVAIYDSGWSYNNALVVCKQLGYPYLWAIPYEGYYFGKGKSLLEYYNVACTGNEATITQCSYSTIPRQTSTNYISPYGYSTSNKSAGVSCLGPSTNIPECSNGDVLLADGPSTREGRLKICKRDGFWGSVCVAGVNKIAALIICRSLGFNTKGVTLSSGKYRTNTGPVLSSISCTGSESHVNECIFGNVGTLNCGHDKDAVISCLNEEVFYDVTVTTDPPNGPFTIGSTIALYCHSNPPLPPGVTYIWRAALYSSTLYSASPQAANANVTIGLNHPSIGHYYCVVNSGTSTLGVGKADISVQSLITSTLNPTISFVPPQTIVLTINLTEIDVTKYLRSLTWYHEGNPITAGGRVMISPDSTTLTIMNTVESDTGTYEVKHMGVVTSNRQEKCEARMLGSLRKYPILAGLKFTVTASDGLYGSDHPILFQVIPLTTGGPLPIQLNWTTLPEPDYTWNYITYSYVTSMLYYNGLEAPSGIQTSSGVLLTGANSAYQNVTIVSSLDSGYLDASLVIYPFYYLYPYGSGSSLFYCPYDYYYFVVNTLGISYIQLDSSHIRFANATQPQVLVAYNNISIPSTEMSISITGHTVLMCTSQGGYPPFVTSRWIKNGQTVAEGTNVLTIDTATSSNPYGLYVCSVDNTVLVTERSVLIKGEGNIQLELWYTSGGTCSYLSYTQLATMAASINANITAILTRLYKISLDEADIKHSITCTSDGQALLYTATISYSSASGDITGSTLAAQLVAWLLVQDSPTLTANGHTFKVYPVMSAPQAVSSLAGPVTGAFIGGLSIGVLLAILVAIAAYMIIRRKMAAKVDQVFSVAYEARADHVKVQLEDTRKTVYEQVDMATLDDANIYEQTQGM